MEEDDFNQDLFCGVVIGVHVFGLAMKILFYHNQHPWMKLSDASKCIENLSYAILGSLAIFVIGVVLYVAIHYNGSTLSNVLFILLGLCLILVSKLIKSCR